MHMSLKASQARSSSRHRSRNRQASHGADPRKIVHSSSGLRPLAGVVDGSNVVIGVRERCLHQLTVTGAEANAASQFPLVSCAAPVRGATA